MSPLSRLTQGFSVGTSFLGHFTRRFLPGFGFLNIRSALMRNLRLSRSSPSSFTCWSCLLAAECTISCGDTPFQYKREQQLTFFSESRVYGPLQHTWKLVP